jgi:hypothetical protein
MLVNKGFHKQENFSDAYSQFGHAPSTRFASLVGKKGVENSGFKGRPDVSVQFRKLHHFWFTNAINLLMSFTFGPGQDWVCRKVDLNVQTVCSVASTNRITRCSVLSLLLKVPPKRLQLFTNLHEVTSDILEDRNHSTRRLKPHNIITDVCTGKALQMFPVCRAGVSYSYPNADT